MSRGNVQHIDVRKPEYHFFGSPFGASTWIQLVDFFFLQQKTEKNTQPFGNGDEHPYQPGHSNEFATGFAHLDLIELGDLNCGNMWELMDCCLLVLVTT